jgi:hypothetical protein
LAFATNALRNGSNSLQRRCEVRIVKISALFSLAIASVLLAIVDDIVPDNAKIVCKIGMIFVWVAIALVSISVLC